MKYTLGGRRPLPRLALLGSFDESSIEKLGRYFPTIWHASNIEELNQQTNPNELELLVIGEGIGKLPDWIDQVHVICFSSEVIGLPGQKSHHMVVQYNKVDTEEFVLPKLPLSWSRQRDSDFIDLLNVKGWVQLHSVIPRAHSPDEKAEALNNLISSALISNPHSLLPLAVVFIRLESNLGIAWLPNSIYDQVAWVKLIISDWAKIDPDSFPGFSDWIHSSEWITQEEKVLLSQIENLENKKQETISSIDKKIVTLSQELDVLTQKVNSSLRRLITAQGDELVEEVLSVFQEFGFTVQNIDQTLSSDSSKREDLRIQAPEHEGWEAIVEVRGYSRSAGKTSDLSRLARFASFYQFEKNKFPDKRIYVINGQIDLLPSQRQNPLSSSLEDIEVFAEQNGVVISTLDLFHFASNLDMYSNIDIRLSIIESKGYWKLIKK